MRLFKKLHTWTYWHRTDRGLERVCMECWEREVANV
jgi:hypothetical protein